MERHYRYQGKYIIRHIEEIGCVDSGVFDGVDSDMFNICISDDKSGYIVTAYDDSAREVLSFRDNGETKRFFKGLGKLCSAAYIASKLLDGDMISLSDKHGNKFYICRVYIIGNEYIVTGGYDNPTDFIPVIGDRVDDIISHIICKLISVHYDYGILDFKSMFIRVPAIVASKIEANLLSKPYIQILH